MAQDIRELMKQDQRDPSVRLPDGHLSRFETRLEKALPRKKTSSRTPWMQIAAVLVVVLAAGFFFLYENSVNSSDSIVETPVEEKDQNIEKTEAAEQVTLADISPQFKEIEDYYMANLNLGLAKLNVNEENKALIDAFMAQLAVLDKEYTRLNSEITESGLNAETVEALINNLQLRLDLLFKLKNKLDELKKEKNEKFEKNQA